MDNIKDTNKMDVLSRFFDKYAVRTNPFGVNQSADLAYRRAERIVAGVYLVTNHVPSDEPLRRQLRSEAPAILEHILELRSGMRAVDSSAIVACRVSIRHLISLIRMTAVSGLVSIQNTGILIESLDELGNYMSTSASSPLSESVPLSKEDLSNIHEQSVKDIKDVRVIKDKTVVRDIAPVSASHRLGDDLSVREKSIMEILRVGGDLGIKDVASHLPEYSEKMIQRDLARLVSIERVKKTGLKRWSRYSLAQ